MSRWGGVTKELDLDGGGSVPSTGYDNGFTTYRKNEGTIAGENTITNSSATLLFVIATFLRNKTTDPIQATITNNGKVLLAPFNVFYAGGTFGIRSTATFLLLKGDTLTFLRDSPYQMVSRVIIP